jgi:predicted CoA-binding protein
MTGVEAPPGGSDRELAELLASARSIAVVGIKAGAGDDAFRVPHYLAQQGYRIVPVNPRLDAVLGERALASLSELREPVDVVDLFRASAHVPGHVDEILALPSPPRLVWMQLGVADEPSAERLRRAGIAVVQDRCLMVEHRRLLGAR